MSLNGTHLTQRHLEKVFRTMRSEWACTYFKLDANFWAQSMATFLHPRATRYPKPYRPACSNSPRRGEGFISDCIIRSGLAGLIHGSRSLNDIKRIMDRIKTTARQTLSRTGQNGRCWWNDPDAICLTVILPLNEFQFMPRQIALPEEWFFPGMT